ncbi:thymidylate synthase [Pseudoalteromonas umbrosa]|uniref:thymidylate synthase n=1 Tax=Pseudoalteromonas umbrosa TaxID=3048489 RepID=UPI0024C416DD|nr:thymidylate synthase [Pseudoalteromonas sp. B95]MDK1290165.1 thymidylate synthase [Pseudoalteromonas sp. B95]
MKQYQQLAQRILDHGHWIENSRTGTRCLTLIGTTLEYDCSGPEFEIVTTRKVPFKLAVAELLGYLRGATSAKTFRQLGTRSWDANANENSQWLTNPNRQGEDDMGKVYGAVAKDFGGIDLIRKVYDNLKNNCDDRGEIITFYKPDEFDKGCLRPCMHTHNFALSNGTLYLESYQRSCDVPLGLAGANTTQVQVLLRLMAQITGHQAGRARHHITNAHIYDNQVELMRDVQLKRSPLPNPKIWINPDIKTLEDVETWVTTDDFKLVNYQSHDAIRYPFSV